MKSSGHSHVGHSAQYEIKQEIRSAITDFDSLDVLSVVLNIYEIGLSINNYKKLPVISLCLLSDKCSLSLWRNEELGHIDFYLKSVGEK